MFKSKKNIFLVVILGLAIFTRFYNLNWGSPYYFHPDERNMANAISGMKWPDLNPHFFAYGQFPLYLAYFSGTSFNLISSTLTMKQFNNETIFSISFPQAIFFLRFYSALSQVLLIYIIYLISKKLFNSKNTNYQILYTTTATVFLPGLIQYSHFGTTESFLTLFLFSTVYFSLKIADNSAKWSDYFLLILTLGFSLGTKLTGLIFFPIPIFSLFLSIFSPTSHFDIPLPTSHFPLLIKRLTNLFKILTLGLLIIFSSIIISFLVSPYNLWQYQDFVGALNYESDVATGKSLVFYTRQFINTKPFLFQFEKIFPYTVGPLLTIFGVAGFLLIMTQVVISIINKLYNRFLSLRGRLGDRSNPVIIKSYIVLIFSFLIYFIPNAVLFAKWTRFMTPIFPFFTIFSGYFFYRVCHCDPEPASRRVEGEAIPKEIPKARRDCFVSRRIGGILAMTIIGLIAFPGLNFFYHVYAREDIRLSASRWIYQNIPTNSHILSETGNVIDIPVSLPPSYPSFPSYPTSFDFYHLDENPELFNQLIDELEKSDYIFIPSRRIFANYTRLKEKFPLTAKYYDLLFSGQLGFVKIKEFKRLNDEQAEETWTVFDHPRIQIFKKINKYPKNYYQELF